MVKQPPRQVSNTELYSIEYFRIILEATNANFVPF